ncbi:hypothetical protein IVA79_12830 [Bradyrhizobium sp. 138]|uniref:hypothetical protein n=1 Tax=Bradyrhizobium sp. 138 TaxID=2782615 RepID=UPI001FFBD3B7|nr:hypothetical protein [Bradyrhizobium sp. 138]MCK1734823.1 hypothetical protein [Bradyrhizobium sp. 138]
MDQVVTGAALAARKAAGVATLVAGVCTDPASLSGVGSIGMTMFGGGADALETNVVVPGGWMDVIFPSEPIPSNASSFKVNLYASLH